MPVIKKTVLEVVVLGILGLALGFGVNAVRAKGSIKPSKNYFETGVPTGVQAAEKEPATVAAPPAAKDHPESAARNADAPQEIQMAQRGAEINNAAPEPQAEPVADADSAGQGTNGEAGERPAEHVQHDYQSIVLKDVVAVLENPLTAKGLNAFVDARNDQHFAEGHIPGAVQFDPYQVDQYLPAALEKANAAEKVIVYCNGGDCEDSIFACRELLLAGVPYDAIYLFEGGWKEWEAAKLPIEKDDK